MLAGRRLPGNLARWRGRRAIWRFHLLAERRLPAGPAVCRSSQCEARPCRPGML